MVKQAVKQQVDVAPLKGNGSSPVLLEQIIRIIKEGFSIGSQGRDGGIFPIEKPAHAQIKLPQMETDLTAAVQ